MTNIGRLIWVGWVMSGSLTALADAPGPEFGEPTVAGQGCDAAQVEVTARNGEPLVVAFGDSGLLEGSWKTHYTTAQGQEIASQVQVAGSAGWYTLPAPSTTPAGAGRTQTGALSDLRQEDGVVQGRWSAAGTDGWLRFDVNGDAFVGTWGQGELTSPAKGTWNGVKE